MENISTPSHIETDLKEEKLYDSVAPVGTCDGDKAPTISARCGECIQHYHLLCDELEDYTTEQATDVGLNEKLALATMNDARSRFKAWATNIAALQKPSMKSSLDSRLSEATEIRLRILRILDDLRESLNKSFKIISGEIPNERWRLGAVSDSEEEEPVVDESDDGPAETSDLEQLFKTIQDSNTSLMKLSMIIRNSPARDDYLKAASRYSSYPADWYIKHVQEKHGDAKGSRDWLIERLGKAILRRRQYLMYRREHHDKLSRDYEATVHKKDEERTNALTKATTFVGEKVIDGRDGSDVAGSFGSQTSYEPTVMGEQAQLATKLTVPDPPTTTAEGVPFRFGEVFTCPYCWVPQVVKNKLAWKKHVFHDLKPYVCTFKPCSLRMFRSRNEWFAHELQNHRREWRCYLCSELYNSESSLSNHLSSKHSLTASGTKLQALILKSEEPIDRVSTSACMLCDEWEANLTNPNQNSRRAFLNQGQTVKPYGTLGQFRRHLGRHMEQLALFALPMDEATQEEEEPVDEVRVDEVRVDDSPDLAVQKWRQESVGSSGSGSDNFDKDFTEEDFAPVIEPQAASLGLQPTESFDVRNELAKEAYANLVSETSKKELEKKAAWEKKLKEENKVNASKEEYEYERTKRELEEHKRRQKEREEEEEKRIKKDLELTKLREGYKLDSMEEVSELERAKKELAAYKATAMQDEKRIKKEIELERLRKEKNDEELRKRGKKEQDVAIEKYKIEQAEKAAKETEEKEEREEEYQARLEEDLRKSGIDQRTIADTLAEATKKSAEEKAPWERNIKEEQKAAIIAYEEAQKADEKAEGATGRRKPKPPSLVLEFLKWQRGGEQLKGVTVRTSRVVEQRGKGEEPVQKEQGEAIEECKVEEVARGGKREEGVGRT